ncbi:MFS transporter [Legionella septentrionalis]|uniref:MFS transporter n=1 Tax=Legionella septentrionalis TaxID=2498109 RepID=UPI000F8E566C|nr:MFS transporter [Legionella septentrionalis]RUQ99776.1 MFS transporter [Legionella septentrionalis]RUR11030.1 MFS transporter [Legionella septentrionalis]
MGSGAFYLLRKKTFLPLFLTQFFGAFNDNAFKLATLTVISYFLSTSQMQSEKYQAIAGTLFIAPFFLFSATAGQIADKFDKARITRLIKLFELVLMIIGAFGLFYGHIFLMLTTLTGMGIHSTFFGPVKYAILPDHLPEKELLGATALIEGSTFLAILLGTTLGALSVGGARMGAYYAIFLTIMAALCGLTACFFIPAAPPVGTEKIKVDWCLWRVTYRMLRGVILNKRILPAVFAISWFWLIGAVILTKLPDYTNYILRAQTSVFAVFLALFSIGIAIGSLVINRLLAGEITLRYVAHAMLLLSVFTCDLYWATPPIPTHLHLQSVCEFFSQIANLRITVDLFLLAFAGGLFVVPLYTYLQVACDGPFRARTIAANNIFNALFMVLGTILVMVLLYFHIVIPEVFLIIGILNIVAAILFHFLNKR